MIRVRVESQSFWAKTKLPHAGAKRRTYLSALSRAHSFKDGLQDLGCAPTVRISAGVRRRLGESQSPRHRIYPIISMYRPAWMRNLGDQQYRMQAHLLYFLHPRQKLLGAFNASFALGHSCMLVVLTVLLLVFSPFIGFGLALWSFLCSIFRQAAVAGGRVIRWVASHRSLLLPLDVLGPCWARRGRGSARRVEAGRAGVRRGRN